MKLKPILFSGEMVRAILDGRKTQTRRVIKPQPEYVCPVWETPYTGEAWDKIIKCPYGRSGDRLWVRETFAAGIPGCPNVLTYRADHIDPRGDGQANPIRWRPSIHMPRKASRITLEVIKIRVERLQDISEVDAKAEGVRFDGMYWLGGLHPVKKTMQCWPTAKMAFERTWNIINKKRGYGWERNPWVWVIDFSTIKK